MTDDLDGLVTALGMRGSFTVAETEAMRVGLLELRAARTRIAAVEKLCGDAVQRGQDSLPPGTTVSGFTPMDALLTPGQVRAALAGAVPVPPADTKETTDE